MRGTKILQKNFSGFLLNLVLQIMFKELSSVQTLKIITSCDTKQVGLANNNNNATVQKEKWTYITS